MTSTEEILLLIEGLGKGITAYSLSPADVVFEERVRLGCFTCPKYNRRATCPPRIPDLNWMKMFREEYENGLLVLLSWAFGNKITADDRLASSVELDAILLTLESFLWERNCPLAYAFGGGSCKACEADGGKCLLQCPPEKQKRIPLEAIGVNVVKTCALVGVDVVFPPKNFFYRVGLLVW